MTKKEQIIKDERERITYFILNYIEDLKNITWSINADDVDDLILLINNLK